MVTSDWTFKRKREYRDGRVVVACEGLNFIWNREEVSEFRKMWREGYSLDYMADFFYRKREEVIFLVMDQTMRNNIMPRKGFIWGEVTK